MLDRSRLVSASDCAAVGGEYVWLITDKVAYKVVITEDLGNGIFKAKVLEDVGEQKILTIRIGDILSVSKGELYLA